MKSRTNHSLFTAPIELIKKNSACQIVSRVRNKIYDPAEIVRMSIML